MIEQRQWEQLTVSGMRGGGDIGVQTIKSRL